MRAIIDIVLAIIFSVVVGSSGAKVLSTTMKKGAIIKVFDGLGSLEVFTQKLTSKK